MGPFEILCSFKQLLTQIHKQNEGTGHLRKMTWIAAQTQPSNQLIPSEEISLCGNMLFLMCNKSLDFVKLHTNKFYISSSHHLSRWVTFKLEESSLGKYMPEEFKTGSHTLTPFKYSYGHFNQLIFINTIMRKKTYKIFQEIILIGYIKNQSHINFRIFNI